MKVKMSPERERGGTLTKVGVQQLFAPFHFHDIESYLILNETGSYFAIINHQSQGPK